jgi:hypothetical protein
MSERLNISEQEVSPLIIEQSDTIVLWQEDPNTLYVCDATHAWRGHPTPFVVSTVEDVPYTTGDLCPHCYIDSLKRLVPRVHKVNLDDETA